MFAIVKVEYVVETKQKTGSTSLRYGPLRERGELSDRSTAHRILLSSDLASHLPGSAAGPLVISTGHEENMHRRYSTSDEQHLEALDCSDAMHSRVTNHHAQ